MGGWLVAVFAFAASCSGAAESEAVKTSPVPPSVAGAQSSTSVAANDDLAALLGGSQAMLESLESTAMSEAAVCVSEAGLEMPGSSSIPPSQDRRYGLPEQADSSFGYRNPAGLSPPLLEPTLTAELARAM